MQFERRLMGQQFYFSVSSVPVVALFKQPVTALFGRFADTETIRDFLAMPKFYL